MFLAFESFSIKSNFMVYCWHLNSAPFLHLVLVTAVCFSVAPNTGHRVVEKDVRKSLLFTFLKNTLVCKLSFGWTQAATTRTRRGKSLILCLNPKIITRIKRRETTGIERLPCIVSPLDVDGLVAFYPFNSAHTTKDMLGSQLDGIASNVQLATGPKGNAGGSYRFMGTSNSYIELPNSGGLDTMYSLTVVMWIYPEGPTAGPLFNYGTSTTNLWRLHFWIAVGGNFFFRPADRQGNMYSSVTSPATSGQWHYVAVSYDYNIGVARLWIDGVEKGKETVGVFQLATDLNVRIGVKTGDARYFKGRVTGIQVYNVALNLDQIMAVKTRGEGWIHTKYQQMNAVVCFETNSHAVRECVWYHSFEKLKPYSVLRFLSEKWSFNGQKITQSVSAASIPLPQRMREVFEPWGTVFKLYWSPRNQFQTIM